MNTRSLRALSVTLIVLAALSVARDAASAAESPTGRRPRLLWTPERQDVWNRMVAENHPWWRRLEAWADATGTDGERYGDDGQCATLAYQWTGEARYARAAWQRIKPTIDTMRPAWNNRNGTREEFITWVWMYDWLYPALAPDERALFIKYLNTLGDLCLDNVEGVPWGTRLGDSDETTGHYFGLAFLDLATGPDNPRAGTFLDSATRGGVKVGGLDATETAMTTMRNAISYYVARAKGGAWIESSEYNAGTPMLLFIGVEGVRTATGVEHFPEVRRLTPEVGLQEIQKMSSGVFTDDQYFQWGDCEHPRTLRIQNEVALLGAIAGLTQGDADGPSIQRFANELAASPLPYADRPWPRFFLFYNPYAPEADWRATFPKGYFAEGQGLLFARSGWDEAASFFGAHMPGRTGVDHEVDYMGDFQLLRHGEWAMTHPIAYDGDTGDRMNSMLIHGLSSCAEVREATVHDISPRGEYAYIAGVTGGQLYRQGYWSAPPAFLDEWTRSIFYLQSPDGKSDTVVVHDRVNARDPKTLERWPDRYYPRDKERIETARAGKQWFIHMPVEPAIAKGTIDWQTPGGQSVRVNTLMPADAVAEAFDEKVIGVPGYIHDSEKKWQARVRPGAEREWDTFLNVIQASDGPLRDVRLVRSADGAVEAALLAGGAGPDCLVVFNARPGVYAPQPPLAGGGSVYSGETAGPLERARLQHDAFTLSWEGASADTTVYLMDLAAGEWTTGGAELSKAGATGRGLVMCRVAGKGKHVLTVSPAAGAPQDGGR